MTTFNDFLRPARGGTRKATTKPVRATTKPTKAARAAQAIKGMSFAHLAGATPPQGIGFLMDSHEAAASWDQAFANAQAVSGRAPVTAGARKTAAGWDRAFGAQRPTSRQR